MFRYFRVALMSCFCATIFAAPLCAQPPEPPKNVGLLTVHPSEEELAIAL